jgi:hypothetical protein
MDHVIVKDVVMATGVLRALRWVGLSVVAVSLALFLIGLQLSWTWGYQLVLSWSDGIQFSDRRLVLFQRDLVFMAWDQPTRSLPKPLPKGYWDLSADTAEWIGWYGPLRTGSSGWLYSDSGVLSSGVRTRCLSISLWYALVPPVFAGAWWGWRLVGPRKSG